MDSLVQYLSEGDHPIEADVRPEKTLKGLKECVDRGFVHVLFTDTRGGTNLGVKIDPSLSDLNSGDFSTGKGNIRVAGHLRLNYVPVTCVAEIDLETLTGKGKLTIDT